jgi:hypothetical protein
MKLITAMFLTFILIYPAVCEETEIKEDKSIGNQQENNETYAKYNRMKNTGIIMAVLGGATLVTGIVLFSTQISRPAGPMTDKEMNNQISGMVGGFVCIAIGIPLTITGTILGVIGGKVSEKNKPKANIIGGYNYKEKKIFAGIEYNY